MSFSFLLQLVHPQKVIQSFKTKFFPTRVLDKITKPQDPCHIIIFCLFLRVEFYIETSVALITLFELVMQLQIASRKGKVSKQNLRIHHHSTGHRIIVECFSCQIKLEWFKSSCYTSSLNLSICSCMLLLDNSILRSMLLPQSSNLVLSPESVTV